MIKYEAIPLDNNYEELDLMSELNKRVNAEEKLDQALDGVLPEYFLSTNWGKVEQDRELYQPAVGKDYKTLLLEHNSRQGLSQSKPLYDCLVSAAGYLYDVDPDVIGDKDAMQTIQWQKEQVEYFVANFGEDLLSACYHHKSENNSHIHFIVTSDTDMEYFVTKYLQRFPETKAADDEFTFEGQLSSFAYVPQPREHDDANELVYDLRSKMQRQGQSQRQQDILNIVVDYYNNVEAEMINAARTGKMELKDFFEHVQLFLTRGNKVRVAPEELPVLLQLVNKAFFGYYVLDDLINDDSISDIRVMAPDHIRVKRNGKRMTSNLTFRDEKDYLQFLEGIAIRNKTTLENYNAVQNFTDTEGNKRFILRFDISTSYVNSTKYPYLIIRKVPRKKYTMKDLMRYQMLDQNTAVYLIDKAKNSSGILFTGKGGSGKTSLMNTLLEYIPYDKSALVIQENEELHTDTHPDIMFQRTVTARGKNELNFNLKDLAINGLLADLDYFIIGEIKGGEALYAMNAMITGHKCWASCHGSNPSKAMYKFADYIKYEADYSKEDCLKMLEELDIIVFMKDFKVYEIAEVTGWSDTKKDLTYHTIYKRKKNIEAAYVKLEKEKKVQEAQSAIGSPSTAAPQSAAGAGGGKSGILSEKEMLF